MSFVSPILVENLYPWISTSRERVMDQKKEARVLCLGILCFFVAVGSLGCAPDGLKAIERYSDQTKGPLLMQMETYTRALQASGAHQKWPKMRAHLTKKTLPALTKVIATMSRIRPGTSALRSIHGRLAKAYQVWAEALGRFTTETKSEADWVRHAHKLQQEAAQLKRAEQTYRVSLKQYIRRLRRRSLTKAKAPTS